MRTSTHQLIDIHIVCVFLQIGLMLIDLFQTKIELPLVGLLCLLCSPSEGASVLLTVLSEADVAFSVTLSAVDSVCAIGRSKLSCSGPRRTPCPQIHEDLLICC